MRLLSLPAFVHLIYFGVLLPYRTWRNRNLWTRGGPPQRTRLRHYAIKLRRFLMWGMLSLSTLLLLWFFDSRAPAETSLFVFGRTVARPADVWSGLFPAEWPSGSSLLLGLVAYVVMVLVDLWYSRRCLERGDPHMYFASPETQQERVRWIAVSAAAGLTEELTWRGLQPEIIAQLTGHLWPAVVICAATFGIGHVRQGRAFVPIAASFALAFHLLTLFTGALYVPILVHVAINVTVGLSVAGGMVGRYLYGRKPRHGAYRPPGPR